MVAPLAIAAVGSSLLGGLFGAKSKAKAAKQAAAAQVAAQEKSLAFQQDIFNQQKAITAPNAGAGASALARQMILLGMPAEEAQAYVNSEYGALGLSGAPQVSGFTPQSVLESSPGYQFRLNEGTRALQQSAAARGGLYSGGTGRALQRYGQDYASNEFGDYYDRLAGVSAMGQNASNTLVNASGALGRAGADAYTNIGNARATGYQQRGDAWNTFWTDTVPGAAGALGGMKWG